MVCVMDWVVLLCRDYLPSVCVYRGYSLGLRVGCIDGVDIYVSRFDVSFIFAGSLRRDKIVHIV